MADEKPASQEPAPGLKFRRQGQTAYWCASVAGYEPRTVNLTRFDPDERRTRCRQLQAEMLAWAQGSRRSEPAFDGTIRSVIDVYLTDPKSSFAKLKRSSAHPYRIYANKLHLGYGSRLVRGITGREIVDWFDVWRTPAVAGGRSQLGRANMIAAVLRAALSHGALCGFEGCAGLLTMLREARFEKPRPRDHAPEAAIIEAACKAAHAVGHPRAALAFALQFETTARQWDIIGQWHPLSDPRPSAVITHRRKWFGLTWSAIDASGILRITPTKTENRTRAKVAIDLNLCPMVMAEMRAIKLDARVGPVIINPNTGLPYTETEFRRVWRKVRITAGLDPLLWNRDLRAGGTTEAQQSGARAEDRAKMSAHSQKTNEAIYSRDVLTASTRVMEARIAHRAKTKGE